MQVEYKELLARLGINLKKINTGQMKVTSPIDGMIVTKLSADNKNSYKSKITQCKNAFRYWRDVPAPKRGELIRIFANKLRQHKKDLGALVTIESGKILEEGCGEVQEMIDICDYAVGLSRIIGGLTLPSERLDHVMEENWYPLGVVGVISAFNFPVAVWCWNFALSIICGNSVIWKPSEKTPVTALACQALFNQSLEEFDLDIVDGLMHVLIGDYKIGDLLVNDENVNLVSATGSSAMGKIVGPKVAQRFARSLLELGGNNAIIVTNNADLEIAIPSILFGAVGTAGQRCTTTRRIFAHKDILVSLHEALINAYENITDKIGNPLVEGNLVGPLIDESSYKNMQKALQVVRKNAAEIFGGERILEDKYKKAYYVKPSIVKLDEQIDIVKSETFAPILYIMPYENLEDAIYMQNNVSQGLSSAIFTSDVSEAYIFKKYSDCGIANVNIGTSGAEIGGAFGGEKETGGGRESGSDSWKYYMRRQTSTTYYGKTPAKLAQNINFCNG